MAHIIHHVAGRTRLHASGKRHDREYFRLVKKRIDQTEGLSAQVNPVTGSILIRHPHDTTEELVKKLVEAGLSDLLDVDLGVPVSLVTGGSSPISIIMLVGWGLFTIRRFL